MRIAVVSENSSYGGISSYCMELCRSLLGMIDITLIIPLDARIKNNWLVEKAVEYNIPYCVVHLNNRLWHDVKELKKILESYDIVHTNGYRLNTLVRIIRLFSPFSFKNIKHIVTIHSVLYRKIASSRQMVYVIMDNIGHIMNTYTITVSDFTLKYVLAYSLAPKRHISTIYHGTKEKSIPCVHKMKTSIVVSFIGRLSQEKGVLFLSEIIEVFLMRYSHLNVSFEICGDGEMVSHIQSLANHHSGKVIYKGYVNDVHTQLTRSHILVLTSKIETFGLVLIEAMLSNVCVIATNVGGVPEIIRHNYNGMLVNYGDVEHFVNTLYEVVMNPAMRGKMIDNAHEVLVSKFSIEKERSAYLHLITTL